MEETFKRQSSKLATISLVCIYSTAIFAILSAVLPFWAHFSLVVLLLGDAWWLIAREGYLYGDNVVVSLTVNRQYWFLRDRAEHEIRGEIIHPSFTSNYFSILRLRAGDGKCYSLVIFRDGLCAKAYRRFVIRLKYSRI